MSRAKRYNWNDNKCKMLSKLYLQHDNKTLAKMFNTNKKVINHKLNRMGLRRPINHFMDYPNRYLMSDGSFARNDPLYNTYKNILARCYYDKHHKYYRYGELGIIVCEQWLASFETFRNWCLMNMWEPGYELHRLYPDSNYCERHVVILTPQEHHIVHRILDNDEARDILHKRFELNMSIINIHKDYPQVSYYVIYSICYGISYKDISLPFFAQNPQYK